MCLTLPEDANWLYRHYRKRTAIHEAGHLAMAILEDCHFEDVTLGKSEISNATVRHLKVRPRDDKVVRISLAGIMAVRMSRCRWYYTLFDSAFDDVGIVAEFARSKHLDIEWNVRATASQLKAHWNAVESLAVNLLQRKTLTHADCHGIFDAYSACEREQTLPVDLKPIVWQRLIKHIQWRIEYPGGAREAYEAFMADIASGGTGMGIKLHGY